MVEPIMYIAIGFLVAALLALVVIPHVHNRAVRLTTKRLQAALPQSMAEIRAGKDQLRAEFATSTRRLELKIDQLKKKSASYFAELAMKSGVIDKLKRERDAQQTENVALKAQLEALTADANDVIDELEHKAAGYFDELGALGAVISRLKIEREALQARIFALTAGAEDLAVGGNRAKAEGSVDSAVLPEWPEAEMATVPADSVYGLTPGDPGRDGVAVSFVPNVWPVADLLRVRTDFPPANDQTPRGDVAAALPAEGPAAETVDAATEALPPPANDQASVATLVAEPEPTDGADEVPTEGAHSPPANDPPHDGDVAAALPAEGPAAETVGAATETLPPPPANDQGKIANLVAKQERTDDAIEALTEGPRSPPANDQPHRGKAVSRFSIRRKADDLHSGGLRRAPNVKRDPSYQRIAVGRERADFSAGLRTGVPPIRMPSRDEFAGKKRSHGGAVLARLVAAVPIVAGAIGWHYYGQEATEMVKTRIASLGWLSSVPGTKSFPDAEVAAARTGAAPGGQASAPGPASQSVPAAEARSPEPVQREPQAVVRDLDSVRHGVEELTAQQEQMAESIATPRVAERSTAALSVPRRESWAHLTPAPETRPITIAGWTLLEVTDDAVILEGPNGVWRATRGDLVPGVGTVDSVVRWGSRWIVATSSGLISTP
jgi:hypothetical protein